MNIVIDDTQAGVEPCTIPSFELGPAVLSLLQLKIDTERLYGAYAEFNIFKHAILFYQNIYRYIFQWHKDNNLRSPSLEARAYLSIILPGERDLLLGHRTDHLLLHDLAVLASCITHDIVRGVHTGHMIPWEHTGHMLPWEHTGHMLPWEHTGHMLPWEHTGHMIPCEHTGHMITWEHTGHMLPWEHTGHMIPWEHTGHMIPWEHTGHMITWEHNTLYACMTR